MKYCKSIPQHSDSVGCQGKSKACNLNYVKHNSKNKAHDLTQIMCLVFYAEYRVSVKEAIIFLKAVRLSMLRDSDTDKHVPSRSESCGNDIRISAVFDAQAATQFLG